MDASKRSVNVTFDVNQQDGRRQIGEKISRERAVVITRGVRYMPTNQFQFSLNLICYYCFDSMTKIAV